jgi:hypothetical protein
VVPRWAYARLRDTRPGEPPEPIAIANGVARRSAKQVKEHMLCGDCEQKLGVYDNDVSKLACEGGRFPALACVGRIVATASEGSELADAGSLDSARLIYFACSIVWRGHEAQSLPECKLGPLAEDFRSFVNAERGPPPKVIVTLSLLRNEAGSANMASIVTMPLTQRKRPHFTHEFALCGLYFAVSTGNHNSAWLGLADVAPIITLVAPAKYKSWFPNIGATPFKGHNPPKPTRPSP